MASEEFLESLGFAIAFGYFLYLKDGPFKDLRKRLQSFENFHHIELEEKFKKVLILIPKLCICDINKFPELKRKNNMIKVTKDVAGVPDRPYKLTVYESEIKEEFETQTQIEPELNNIKTTEPKYRYYIIDMAQCLDSLHRITINKRPLDINQMQKVTDQFIDVLGYLLSNEKYKGYYEILTFSDGELFCQVLNNKVKIKSKKEIKIDLKCIGTGSAYWYYFNYILLKERDLDAEMKNWEQKQKQELADRKLYILVPNSCICHDDIIQLKDNSLEYAQDFNSNKSQTTVGASYAREYKKSVLSVKDGKKQMYCVTEYATPIRQLYRMFTSNIIEMNDLSLTPINQPNTEMLKQRHNFVVQMKKLLEQRNLYKIITYPDNADDFKVSDLLLRKVKKNCKFNNSLKTTSILEKVNATV